MSIQITRNNYRIVLKNGDIFFTNSYFLTKGKIRFREQGEVYIFYHHEIKAINQYIGRKDDHNKMIYEDDIVQVFHVSSTLQPHTTSGVVKYEPKKARYVVKNLKTYETFTDEDNVFKVLGNIHTNKIMLEVLED